MAARANAHVQGETRRRRFRVLLITVGALLLLGGGVAYAFVSNTVKETIDHITTVSGKVFVTPAPVRPGPIVGSDGNITPVPVTFPDWDKKESVNILLIGLDYRPEEQDSRADTQIVVHIDPAAKTVAMVSIPRDLWVPIPGYGEGRINSAFQKGDHDKATVPGGGPGLAMATIEESLGIHIHYFAQVDFNGFERIVDTMGGVTIDVPRPLADNEYPFQDYGFTRIYIPAGLQHMDGHTALEYARSRHADSDIGRNSRQQQVLLALKQQGLNLNLVSRLNDLADQLSVAVKTDLSITQVGSLAQLAKEIDPGSIQTVVIDANMVTETILNDGADVLMPNWDVIRPKVQQAFANPRLAKENARLSVQNGTTTSGEARKVSDLLVSKGFVVADLSSAQDQGNHPITTITDYTSGQKPQTVQALSEALGIPVSSVERADPSTAPSAKSDGKPVDILVMVGDDRVKK